MSAGRSASVEAFPYDEARGCLSSTVSTGFWYKPDTALTRSGRSIIRWQTTTQTTRAAGVAGTDVAMVLLSLVGYNVDIGQGGTDGRESVRTNKEPGAGDGLPTT